MCHDITEYLDSSVFSLNARSPRARGFETFVALAQNFLAKLQSDYAGDLARYSDWLPFAKHYDRQAQFAHVRDKYETAHASDPEDFLRVRSEFLSALSAAEQFKAKLLSQTAELAALEAQVSDLSRRVTETPISQMITTEEAAAVPKLKNDIVELREMSPPDRGDVSKEIREFTSRKNDFETEISLEAKREAIVAKSAEILSYFKQPEIRVRLSKDAEADISNLAAQTDVLSKLATVRLSERGDYSAKLMAADVELTKIEQYKRQIEQPMQLAQQEERPNKELPADRPATRVQTAPPPQRISTNGTANMHDLIDAHPTLYLALLIYILLAGLISWPLVRRPMIRWWKGLFIATYGPSLIENMLRLFLYRIGFELFVFAVACVVGALGGWIFVVRKITSTHAQEQKPA